ncbi:ABC transporter permease [Bacillus mesophilum]|uniref:ABC transporter permease n=1 Tax=Bacillus mesophilum TaxID=1071718 RepID=A0A7V7RJZ6_9BACI|nr:ABC transporter permease [Bacillus mesophilum]KAB2331403.1 ABC transporter permease [Bacillus mesophilum]
MINYMKSEYYRLLRKKSLHLTAILCYMLIAFAAAVLYYFGEYETNFPYATDQFFYSNVTAAGLVIIIIGLLYNMALTGKDRSLIKQSISFGISRSIIFWSKLILTLGYFLLVCVIGMCLMLLLGDSLLTHEPEALRNFLIVSVNMIPIVLSGFFLGHTLKMLKVGDVYIIIVMLLIFAILGDLLRFLLRPFAALDEVYKYAPDTLLNDNLMSFVNGTPQLGIQYWIVGLILSMAALLIGARMFAKQNID